jgi:hypothetical protein
LSGLLALTCPWVAAKEASGFQRWTKFSIEVKKSTGDGQLDSIGLTV